MMIVYKLALLSLAAGLLCIFCGACQSPSYVNPAAPGINRLQTNNQQEQRHTQAASDDVQDAKDMVRRIEYKDTLLSR